MVKISWVGALLEACDVTKRGRHLGFYQLKKLVITCEINHK